MSMELTIEQLAAATGGVVVRSAPGQTLSGVSTDSRSVRPGDVFFALVGERFDGHDYLAQAVAAGAGAVVVSTWPLADASEAPAVVRVADTTRAYGALGAWWRQRMSARVVGITGSNGKTTTKEMAAHLLAALGPTVKSEANHNNHIGVPETLLRIRPGDAYAVVEMGTNHPGEIDYLAGLAKPDVGVLTNVGPSHLEAFRSERGVAREKANLLRHIQGGGLAVLHADDRWSRWLAREHDGRKTTFGLGPAAEWRAAAIWSGARSIRFELARDGARFVVPVVGRWQTANCLAALAGAVELGLTIPEAAERFQTFEAPDMRMSVRDVHGMTLIVDCYNANPGSMRAALDELQVYPTRGRRVAVLGDMLELGKACVPAHAQVGAFAAHAGVDRLCVVGEHAFHVAGAAVRSGMPLEDVFATNGQAAAVNWLRDELRPGDTVLFKASRGVRLEDVAEGVQSWARTGGAVEPVAAGAPWGAVAAARALARESRPGRETRRG